MTLESQRKQVTPAQATAIEYYRSASTSGDFTALLTSVTELAKVALYEVEAVEAISEGYDVYGDDSDV